MSRAPEQSSNPNYLKVQEAADMLGISYVAMFRACKRGEVQHVVMPSGRLRVLRSEIDRILTPVGNPRC
jgi:predicted site-specific integrase-resolvase